MIFIVYVMMCYLYMDGMCSTELGSMSISTGAICASEGCVNLENETGRNGPETRGLLPRRLVVLLRVHVRVDERVEDERLPQRAPLERVAL